VTRILAIVGGVLALIGVGWSAVAVLSTQQPDAPRVSSMVTVVPAIALVLPGLILGGLALDAAVLARRAWATVARTPPGAWLMVAVAGVYFGLAVVQGLQGAPSGAPLECCHGKYFFNDHGVLNEVGADEYHHAIALQQRVAAGAVGLGATLALYLLATFRPSKIRVTGQIPAKQRESDRS
jgi:hypothetical protein